MAVVVEVKVMGGEIVVGGEVVAETEIVGAKVVEVEVVEAQVIRTEVVGVGVANQRSGTVSQRKSLSEGVIFVRESSSGWVPLYQMCRVGHRWVRNRRFTNRRAVVGM